MATVEKNKNITIMKFNTYEKLEIQIEDNESGETILLFDNDCKFLHKLLEKWLKENVIPPIDKD